MRQSVCFSMSAAVSRHGNSCVLHHLFCYLFIYLFLIIAYLFHLLLQAATIYCLSEAAVHIVIYFIAHVKMTNNFINDFYIN